MNYSTWSSRLLISLSFAVGVNGIVSPFAQAQSLFTYRAESSTSSSADFIEFDDGAKLLLKSSTITLEQAADNSLSVVGWNLFIDGEGTELGDSLYTDSDPNGVAGVIDLLFENDGSLQVEGGFDYDTGEVDQFGASITKAIRFFNREGVSEGEFGEILIGRRFSTGSYTVFTPVTQNSPILPAPPDEEALPTVFIFRGAPSANWFDPTPTNEFLYTMDSPGSFFTEILDFPTGFDPLTVTIDGISQGTFGPGDSFLFPGGGVKSFGITGINPSVDGEDPTAFPLKLAFNTPTADFTQAAVTATTAPEPMTLLGACIAVAFGTAFKQRNVSGKS